MQALAWISAQNLWLRRVFWSARPSPVHIDPLKSSCTHLFENASGVPYFKSSLDLYQTLRIARSQLRSWFGLESMPEAGCLEGDPGTGGRLLDNRALRLDANGFTIQEHFGSNRISAQLPELFTFFLFHPSPCRKWTLEPCKHLRWRISSFESPILNTDVNSVESFSAKKGHTSFTSTYRRPETEQKQVAA